MTDRTRKHGEQEQKERAAEAQAIELIARLAYDRKIITKEQFDQNMAKAAAARQRQAPETLTPQEGKDSEATESLPTPTTLSKTPRRWPTILYWGGVLILVGGVVVYQVSSRRSAERKQAEQARARDEQKANAERMISQLSSQYNADRDWRKKLSEHTTPLFAALVQRALMRDDQRPVLLVEPVSDVRLEKGQYQVYFSNERESGPEIQFILETTPAQANEIIERGAWRDYNYAVVASIVSVEGEARPFRHWGRFIARGRCLDLKFINFHEDLRYVEHSGD